MKLIRTLLLIGISALPSLVAQERKEPLHQAAPQFDIAHSQRPAKSMQVKREDTTGANTDSLSVFQIFGPLTIAPGQTINLFSTADWTGASSVAIAIECPASTSLVNSAISVYWQLPAFTNTYTFTSAVLGSDFLFTNVGGAVVPVFGTVLGLQVTNAGSAPVVCDQLTIYGVVH